MALASIFDVGERLKNKFVGKFGIASVIVMENMGIIRVFFNRDLLTMKEYELSNLVAKNADPFGIVFIPEP